jgi:CRISPR-associated protein Cmr1
VPPSIDITFELVTPAYAGGADISQTDGFRPPTIKALLRFWWRAMYPELSPEDLFAREEVLFGSTQQGQGLRVVPTSPWHKPSSTPAHSEERDSLHGYLAYGAVSWEQNLKAPVIRTERIDAGQRATFKIILPRRATDQDFQQIKMALWLVASFGTIGSRARRGWGSLRLRGDFFDDSLVDPHSLSTVEEIRQVMRSGLAQILRGRFHKPFPQGKTYPLHSALSRHMVIAISRVNRNPKDAAWRAAMMEAKDSYYKFHRLLGTDISLPGVVGPDYLKRKKWLTSPPITDIAPYGTAFGLPQNAMFRSLDRDTVHVGVGSDLNGRRASPIFLKVLCCGNGCVPLVLWLPSQFLPDDTKIYARGDSKTKRPGSIFSPVQVDYPGEDPIRWFFEGGAPGIAWRGLFHNGWTKVVP